MLLQTKTPPWIFKSDTALLVVSSFFKEHDLRKTCGDLWKYFVNTIKTHFGRWIIVYSFASSDLMCNFKWRVFVFLISGLNTIFTLFEYISARQDESGHTLRHSIPAISTSSVHLNVVFHIGFECFSQVLDAFVFWYI